MPGSSLTSLDASIGTAAGRMTPAGWVPTEGSYAFVLGSDVPNVRRKVHTDEFVEIEQSADFSAGKLVRIRAHVRPTSTTSGLSWQLAFRVNRADRVVHVLSRELDRADIAIPISQVASPFTLGAQLRLVGTAGTYEVEIPAAYVDEVIIEDPPARIGLINRVPEPGETDVPISTSITLEVANLISTDAVNDVHIYVDGVLAYDSTVGECNGFTVQTSQIGGVYDVYFDITPPAPFDGESVVKVRVVAESTSVNASIDETYSFTTADIRPPRIESAIALDRQTVRVRFDEPVRQVSSGDTNDALNTENWAFSLHALTPEVPSVRLTAVTISHYDTMTVDISTNTEMTARVLYVITGTNIEDMSRNVVQAPYNFAVFAGYECVAPEARRFDLIDFIPVMNVSEDVSRDLQKFIACLQEPTNLILCDIDDWSDILDPDVAPERFVDVMLSEAGNPFDFDLSLTDKRRLMRVLVPIYKSKGTDAGIINAIRFFLGIEVTITTPAFDGIWDLGVSELGVDTVLGTSDPASLYTFVIHTPIELSDEQRTRIIKIADYMKAAHTHFRIEEPPPAPVEPNHWELGLSELGVNTHLH